MDHPFEDWNRHSSFHVSMPPGIHLDPAGQAISIWSLPSSVTSSNQNAGTDRDVSERNELTYHQSIHGVGDTNGCVERA